MNAAEYKARKLAEAKRRGSVVYNPTFALPGWGPATLRWIEHASRGLRVLSPAPGRGHGWYVDSVCDDTTVPAVLQLPASPDGTRRYMAATSDPYNPDCYLTDCDLTDNPKTAAYWAQRLAERYAEFCREEDAKFQAEQQIADAKSTICELRVQHSRLVEEYRKSRAVFGDIPLMVNAARKSLRSLRADAAEAHKRIKRLTDNYWYAVQ